MGENSTVLLRKLNSIVNKYGGDTRLAEHLYHIPRTVRKLIESSPELLRRFQIPSNNIESIRKIGQKLYFEYHCLESHNSQDAELWYRSHKIVTVVGFASNDGWDIPSLAERFECGHPIVYSVMFKDGFIGHTFEDELLDSELEYSRPDPPLKVIV